MFDDTAVPAPRQPSDGDQFGMPRRDIFEDPTLPSSVKLVYVAMCMFADPVSRECWPGGVRLARNCSLSLRTVATSVRLGQGCGLWTMTRTQTSNRYKLHDRANDPNRYVVGSGPVPVGNGCTLDKQPLPAGRAADAHEVDQRTRRTTKTSSSRDAASGARRASARDAREIKLGWKFRNLAEPGDVIQYLVSAAIAAMRSDGLTVHENAGNAIGHYLKQRDWWTREQMAEETQRIVRHAGTDHANGWLASQRPQAS